MGHRCGGRAAAVDAVGAASRRNLRAVTDEEKSQSRVERRDP
jgi:hypothetical protein